MVTPDVVLAVPEDWTLIPGEPPSWRRVVRDHRDIRRAALIWHDDWDGEWKVTVRGSDNTRPQDVVTGCLSPAAAAAAFEMLDPMRGFKPRRQ